MNFSQSADLFEDFFGPQPLASLARRPGLLVERLDTSLPSLNCFLQ